MSFYEHRLFFIRHGEAVANQRQAFVGRLDDPLTEKGRGQARHLANLLADEPIDEIIASPLQRAADTAAMLAEAKDMPWRTHDALVEQDFGKWDGLTFAEVKQRYPQNFDDWWRDAVNIGPLEGENLGEVTERVWAFYRELTWQKGKTIALVGHGSASQALLCRLMGMPTRGLWPFRLMTGSLTEVEFAMGQPSICRLSWTG